MKVEILDNPQKLGWTAGKKAAELVTKAIDEKGIANIILATGASQFETLKTLVSEDVDWSKVTMFHLDEYVGLPQSHKASFRKYLKERFINKVKKLGEFFLINGEADDLEAECERLDKMIKKRMIDVALVGVGENGHLAFNDPPADFEIEDAYKVVDLDQKCRNQQLGEGWFKNLEEVPQQAISMTIKQVLKAKRIICSVPDLRKAEAVKCSLEGKISNLCPASILQSHLECYFYLDKNSASLLEKYGK